MNFRLPSVLVILLVAVFASAGCLSLFRRSSGTSDRKDSVGPEEAPESPLRIREQDGNFELRGLADGSYHFRIVNRDADIRDLANFSTACYRRHLADKVRACQDLNPSERELLRFCVATQVAALNTYVMTVLGDMTGETDILPSRACNPISADAMGRSADPFEASVADVCGRAADVFQHSNCALRRHIADWGESFRPVPRAAILSDLDGVMMRTPAVRFVPTGWESFCRRLRELFTLATVSGGAEFESVPLQPYRAALDPRIGHRWRALSGDLAPALMNLRTLSDDLRAYIARAAAVSSLDAVDDIRQYAVEQVDAGTLFYSYVVNDLPFAILCKNAAVRIQGCKSVRNGMEWDDEEAMKAVMDAFVQNVSEDRMLIQLHSAYPVFCHDQLLRLFAQELGEDKFAAYNAAGRLHQISGTVSTTSFFSTNAVTTVVFPR